MDLAVPILGVVFAFVIAVGGFYFIRSLRGPRKVAEIEQLMRAGKYRDAIDSLNILVDKDDRNIQVRYLLGTCYAKNKEWSQATAEFRQCVRIGKFSPVTPETGVRRGLGEALTEAGNLTEAKNEFLILTTLEPNVFDNYFQLGRIFFRSEVHDKAVKFLTKAASLNDKHADVLCLLGQSQYHLKAYQDSRASLLKAVQIKPDLRVARYFLGLALRYTGDGDWAVKELDQAERDEGLRDRAILAKAMVYIDQEAFPKAITELQRGLKFVGTNVDSMVNMRYILAASSEKIRDMHAAIENWEAIESIKPGFRDVKQKLAQYSDMRLDDSLKDFIIANNTQFEAICRKVVEKMNLAIQSLQLKNDSTVVIVANAAEEDAAGRRQMRKQGVLIVIERNLDAVSETRVRDIQEAMKDNAAGRVIVMTTGEVTPAAQAYAASRPIELMDASKAAKYVRAAMA